MCIRDRFYILILWLFAQVAGPNKGNAEVVTLNGKVVGAANVGQMFTKDIYCLLYTSSFWIHVVFSPLMKSVAHLLTVCTDKMACIRCKRAL